MADAGLKAKLENLPEKPGVYLLKDEKGKTIYIGKAKVLRNRVRSYFQASRAVDHKTEVLKAHVADLDYVETDSEVEALLLESQMVKRRQPIFNVRLKDDKAFLHIKLTTNEEFPRVLLTRRIKKDGARYFGPYLPAALARNTIKIINRHFLLRTCSIDIDGNLDRPCLEYHIKRCLGPCVSGLCGKEEYLQAVRDVILFLEGKTEELEEKVERRMLDAADKQHFEAAAFYRDRLKMIRELGQRQKMVLSGVDDVDVFAYYREGPRCALQLFTLRGGKIVGKREFFWEDLQFFKPTEFLRDALQQYYYNAGFVPREIHLPVKIEDQELMLQWLTSRHQEKGNRSRVRIMLPKKGEKHDLLLLVERNAKIAFETRFRIARSHKLEVLEHLQEALNLPRLPQYIECFDISTIQGTENVASMVACRDGLMQRKEYRKYKIRSVKGQADDFRAIFEVVSRRYKRLLNEEADLPDLILIDGGKGQLHSAYQALAELGTEDIPLASIAKKEEHLFVQGQAEPVVLKHTSPALHLVQEIRDEAHRFAVTFHRKRRSMRDFRSQLDAVPGVGAKRRKRLLQNFGSLARIRRATVEELTPFVGRKVAEAIKQHL
ncbi:MAG TPA: excinuclease ABC subunit UvrC [Acidobacteriota bacterium]|nr:excinuclease ABC subunit UvrC [Acidobacteriota bacterium]